MNNELEIQISFIIPAYNCQKYIEECVSSILTQEIENIEIIIVDDGSIDKTYEISMKMKKEFSSIIKVFKKDNGGAASARNFGLNKSLGKYIIFIDSDDFLFGSDIKKSIGDMEKYNADLLISDMSLFVNGNIQRNEFCNKNILVQEDVLEYVSLLPKFPGSSCAKIYSRDFLIWNNLSFVEGIVNEDIDFMLECLKKNPKLYHTNYSWYLYRQNVENSVTNTISPRNCIDMFYIVEKNLEKNKNDKRINRILSYEYSTLFFYYNRLQKSDKRNLKNEFKKYRYLLACRTNKEKILYGGYLLFGLDMTAKLITILYYLKKTKK